MKRVPGPPAEVTWSVPGPRLLTARDVQAAVGAALAHGGRAGIRIAVVFVSDPALADLHARHLGDPQPTDVIAFDLGEVGGGPAGEVYVSVDRARAVARARDLPPERELALYVVHGCLHLCGHDDHEPRARARMRRAERQILTHLGYGSGGLRRARSRARGAGARGRARPSAE